MGRVCTGSFYGNDWAVYTREDAIACENAGGHVVESGDSGCASTTAAVMAVPQGTPGRGGLAEMALTPFRAIRSQAGEHELLRALVEFNSAAGPEIDRLTATDANLKAEIVEAFIALGGLAAAVSAKAPPSGRLEKPAFARLEKLARRVAERTQDEAVRTGIERVLTLSRPFVGESLAKIAGELRGPKGDEGRVQERHLPASAVFTNSLHGRIGITLASAAARSKVSFADIVRLLEAEAAIEAKARALGWVGAPSGDVEVVPGGYRRHYENADILVGDSGQAFEVHGDIRAKYNLLGGPGGILGLPVTDETGTPDGIGRYNHFQNQGSIYWTPHTGPMMVRGRVRDEWAAGGWERGPMGYPVADQHAMPPLYPSDHPNLGWCLFENGALLSIAGAAAPALAAEISPDQLKTMVRQFFDVRLKQANSDLGLEARVDLDAIGSWTYGFWAAAPRLLSFGLHGFHDNGVLPDTTFDLQVRLRFSTTWAASFTYPSDLSLIVSLDWWHVHTTGLGAGTLASGLGNGIQSAFYRGGPDPDHPEVPDGAIFLTSIPTGASQKGDGNLDVIDVLTTAAGGLQILVNPLPPIVGGFRKLIAQNKVNAFLEGG